jgi:hypothetical protein
MAGDSEPPEGAGPLGPVPTAERPEGPHSADPGLPEEVLSACLACIDYAERSTGIRLDFESETLPILDHYATLAGKKFSPRVELEPLVALAIGAYFGEVVRRKLGGFWLTSGSVHDWRLCLRPVFLSLNPIGAAYDALHRGQSHDGPRSHLLVAPEDSEWVERRLASVPPTPLEDFYLLATRMEAIEVAVEALRARMVLQGYEEVVYEAEDYLAEMSTRPL